MKAFYITYRTSFLEEEKVSNAQMAEELALRPATLWKFRQKVLSLIEATKNRKKHKDGWTHLIEYSITEDKT